MENKSNIPQKSEPILVIGPGQPASRCRRRSGGFYGGGSAAAGEVTFYQAGF
jgi:hypothetical protein